MRWASLAGDPSTRAPEKPATAATPVTIDRVRKRGLDSPKQQRACSPDCKRTGPKECGEHSMFALDRAVEQFDRHALRPADETDARARPHRGRLAGELDALG